MTAVSAARPQGSERASYGSGLAFGTASFGLVAIVGVASAIATARIFGVDVIGQYALAFAPTGVVWFLSNVREQAALVRELATLEPRAPRVTGLFVAVLSFSTVLTAVVSGLTAVAVWFLFQGPIDQPDLFLPACASLAAYTAITNLGWNLDSIFSSFVSGRRLFWIRLHQALANLAIAVPLGLVWPSVWSLVIATAGSSLTSVIHRVIAVRPLMRARVSRAELRGGFRTLPDLLRFGIRAAPGTVLQGMCNELGTWVLGATGTLAMVGAYNRAWTLSRRFLDLNFRINEMLLPTLVKRRGEGDHSGFDRALVDTMRYAATCMLLIAAAGGGAASHLMALFGAGFSQASDALTILLLLPTLHTLSAIQTNAFYAVGRPTLTTITAGVRVVVTTVATIVGVAELGLTGAALGLIAGLGVDVLVKLRLLRPHLSSPLRRLWTPRQILALCVAYACGFAAARGLGPLLPEAVELVAALTAGTLAFVAGLWVTGGIDARDRERIARIGKRLRRPRSSAAPPPMSATAGSDMNFNPRSQTTMFRKDTTVMRRSLRDADKNAHGSAESGDPLVSTATRGEQRSASPASAQRVGVGEAVARHPLLTLVCVLLGTGAALAAGYARTPTYTSVASLRVTSLDLGAPGALSGLSTASESLATTYALSVDSDRVILPAAQRLKLPVNEVRGSVLGSAVPKSPVFTVTAQTDDPAESKAIANGVAASLSGSVASQSKRLPPNELLREYERQSVLVHEAQRKVAQAQAAYASSKSAANARRLAAERASLETISLQRESLQAVYKGERINGNQSPRVEVMRQAGTGVSDRPTKMQIFLFVGVLGGALIGAALATLRANRIARRTFADATAAQAATA